MPKPSPNERAAAVLQSAFEADPAAIRYLTSRIAVTNAAMEAHPHVIVCAFDEKDPDSPPGLRLIGILNGVVGVLTGGAKIAEKYDDKTGELLGFMALGAEPDTSDGCDCEGFVGGCLRAGHTPETCPQDPRYIRDLLRRAAKELNTFGYPSTALLRDEIVKTLPYFINPPCPNPTNPESGTPSA